MTRLRNLLPVLLVALVAVALVGQLMGQPMVLGYIETDSMEPTIDAGDGFVAIPAVVGGGVEPGDIVVYEAREIHGGGLVTHRIVDVTAKGYITRGDANPFTDQDANEPAVTDEQIVATVLQIDGEPVVIPHLGTAVAAFERVLDRATSAFVSTVLLIVGLGLLTLAVVLDRRRTNREIGRRVRRRNVVSVWTIVVFVVFLLTSISTIAMVQPASTHEYGIVSARAPSEEPGVIQQGETADLVHEVENRGVIPILVLLEPGSDDVMVQPRYVVVGARAMQPMTVSVTTPEQLGRYHRHTTEHRYLAVLPPALLVGLHDVHPLLALLAVNLVVAVVATTLLLLFFGTDDLRVRSIGEHVPAHVRIRRRIETIRTSLSRDDK